MKQRYLLAACLMVSGLCLSSCAEDWLNLEPSTSLPDHTALETVADMEVALNGVYRETSQHSYYGDNHWYYGDCRAVDVQARVFGKNRVVPYYTYNVPATDNNNVVLPWNRPYMVIRQANNILQRIAHMQVSKGDRAAVNKIKAETLSLRALALFNLTRMYGMPYMNDQGASLGVPIEVKPEGPNHTPSRSTVAECYDQVIADFKEAIELGIPKEKQNGHVNYWGVQALLSRVYLNKGDYQLAYDCAQDVIENSKDVYSLYSREEYASVWGKDFQSESIFELFIDTSEPSEWGGGTGGEGAPSVYENNLGSDGWNNLILTEDYLMLLNEDERDVRHVLTEKSKLKEESGLPEKAKGQPVFLTKFPGKNGDVKTNDICIIRLAEVYLNAAEAGLKLDGEAKAKGLAYFNQLVNLRTETESQQATSETFTVARILKERRKELVGEGLLYYDFLRTQTPIERKGQWHLDLANYDAQTIVHTDPRVALPIPQTEQDANPEI